MSHLEENRVQSLIQSLDEEVRLYFMEYLKNAPEWLYNSFSIVTYPKNHMFIEEGNQVFFIYILVKGSVKALDVRVQGAMYSYMWFKPVKAFGALEVMLEDEYYKTTLMTTCPCTFLVVSKAKYEKWIKSDVNALYLETKTTTTHLIRQTRRERIYLFMQGTDRLAYFLIHFYEQFAISDVCMVNLTRQEISDCTGLSVKTVNRSITILTEHNCIGKSGSKIIIEREHFERLQRQVANLVE